MFLTQPYSPYQLHRATPITFLIIGHTSHVPYPTIQTLPITQPHQSHSSPQTHASHIPHPRPMPITFLTIEPHWSCSSPNHTYFTNSTERHQSHSSPNHTDLTNYIEACQSRSSPNHTDLTNYIEPHQLHSSPNHTDLTSYTKPHKSHSSPNHTDLPIT